MPLTVPANAMQGSTNGVTTTVGMTAVNGCKRWLGTPYSWGGGDGNGPSYGIDEGSLIKGFDCSGLAQNGWAYAGVAIPGDTRSQWAALNGQQVPEAQRQAGDLIYYPGHVAMVIDFNTMIEAGDPVQISTYRPPRNNGLGNWTSGIIRPSGGTAIASDGTVTASGPVDTSNTLGALTGISFKAWIFIGVVGVIGAVIVMNGAMS